MIELYIYIYRLGITIVIIRSSWSMHGESDGLVVPLTTT